MAGCGFGLSFPSFFSAPPRCHFALRRALSCRWGSRGQETGAQRTAAFGRARFFPERPAWMRRIAADSIAAGPEANQTRSIQSGRGRRRSGSTSTERSEVESALSPSRKGLRLPLSCLAPHRWVGAYIVTTIFWADTPAPKRASAPCIAARPLPAISGGGASTWRPSARARGR